MGKIKPTPACSKPTEQIPTEVKQWIEQLTTCPQSELSQIIDQIPYHTPNKIETNNTLTDHHNTNDSSHQQQQQQQETEADNSFALLCKKTNIIDWMEVFNRFDTILEQTISSSSILQLRKEDIYSPPTSASSATSPTGIKKTSVEDSATTITSSSNSSSATITPLVDETPEPLLIQKVMNFSGFLLSNIKQPGLYNSPEHIACMLQSENVNVVESALDLFYVLFERLLYSVAVNKLLRKPKLLNRILSFSYGYGADSLRMLFKEEGLDKSVMTKGNSLHYELYSDSYNNEMKSSTPTSKKKQEKTSVNAQSLQVIDIPNVHDGYKTAYELYKQILADYDVPEYKHESLWARIRIVFAFQSTEERVRWTSVRLKSFALLAFKSHYHNFLDIFYTYQPNFETELKTMLEEHLLPHELAIGALRIFTAFFKARSRLSILLTTIFPPGVPAYNNFLVKLLHEVTKPGVQTIQQREMRDALFELLTNMALSKMAHKSLFSSGLVSDAVMLLSANVSEVVTAKALRFLDTFLDHKSTVAQIVQSGVLHEAATLLTRYLSLGEKLREESKDSSTEQTVSDRLSPTQFQILKSCLKIVVGVMHFRSNQVNVRELMEGELLKLIGAVLTNSKFYGYSISLYICKLLAAALNKEPTFIPSVKQAGTFDLFLKIMNGEIIPNEAVIQSIPVIANAFCLNTACSDELTTSGVFQKFLGAVLTEPSYTSIMINENLTHQLGKRVNEFIRHHSEMREPVINCLVSCLGTMNSKASQPGVFDVVDKEKNEFLGSVQTIISSVSDIILANNEVGKMFCDKGGLTLFVQLFLKVPSTTPNSAREQRMFLPVLSLLKKISRSNSTQTFEVLCTAIRENLQHCDSFNDENEDHVKCLINLKLLLRLFLSSCGRTQPTFFADWETVKGPELLEALTKQQINVAWGIGKRRMNNNEKFLADSSSKDGQETTPSSTASLTTVTKRRLSLKQKEKTEDKTLKLMEDFMNFVYRFYRFLQTTIFHGIVDERGANSSSITSSKTLATHLCTNLLLMMDLKNHEDVSIQRKCIYLEFVLPSIHESIVSELYRNNNTVVLSQFLNSKGVHELCNLLENITTKALTEPFTSFNDPNAKGKQSNCFETFLLRSIKLFRRLVSLPYTNNSPVTQSLRVSDPTLDTSKLVESIQKIVAQAIVKLWKMPELFKINEEFTIIFVNVVAHIIKESSTEEKPTQEKKSDPVALATLMSMGFSEKASADALQRCHQDMDAAIEWLVLNPFEEPPAEDEEEENDEDEVEKAIRMSMQDDEEMDDTTTDSTDYISDLKAGAIEWTLEVVRNARSLAFPCADLLSIECKDDETRKKTFNILCDTIKSLSNAEGVKQQSLESLLSTASILFENIPEMRVFAIESFAPILIDILTLCANDLSQASIPVLTHTLEILTQLTGAPKSNQKDTVQYTLEEYSELITKNTLPLETKQAVLQTSLKLLDNPKKMDSQSITSLLTLISNLTMSKELANEVRRLGCIERIISLPASVKSSNFFSQFQVILEHIAEDDTLLLESMKYSIRKVQPSGRAMKFTPNEFLQHFKHLLARNPKLFFKAVKETCKVREKELYLATVEKAKSEPAEQPSNSDNCLEQVLHLLLTEIVTTATTGSKRTAIEQFDLLKVVSEFVLQYNCGSLVLAFKHESMGEDNFLHFILWNLMPYTTHPKSSLLKDNVARRAYLSSKMSAFLLSALTVHHYAEVFTAISKLIAEIPSGTSKSLRTIHAIGDFLLHLLARSRRPTTENPDNLAKLMCKYELASSLADSFEKFDLNHPDTPDATNSVLKPLSLMIRATNACKLKDADLPDMLLSFETELYRSEYKRIRLRDLLNAQNEEEQAGNTPTEPMNPELEQPSTQTIEEEQPDEQSEISTQPDEQSEDIPDDEEEEEEDEEEEDEIEEDEEEEEEDEDEDDQYEPLEEHIVAQLPEEISAVGMFPPIHRIRDALPQVDSIEDPTLHQPMNTDWDQPYEQERDEMASDFINTLAERNPFFRVIDSIGRGDENHFFQTIFDSVISRGGGSTHPRSVLGHENVNIGVTSSDVPTPTRINLLSGLGRFNSIAQTNQTSGLSNALMEEMRDQTDTQPVSPIASDRFSSERPSFLSFRGHSVNHDESEEDSDSDEVTPIRFSRSTMLSYMSDTPFMEAPHNATEQTTESVEQSSATTASVDVTGTSISAPTASAVTPTLETTSTETTTTETDTATSAETPSETKTATPTNETATAASVESEPSTTSGEASSSRTEPVEFAIDPTFLSALPDDLRQEVLQMHIEQLVNTSTTQNAESTISSEFLNALPAEIRNEVLEQERVLLARQRSRAPPVPASTTTSQATSANEDLDAASFIASLAPELRQEILMTADESVLAQLPQDMIAEAYALRTRLPERPGLSLFNSRARESLSRIPAKTHLSRKATGTAEQDFDPILSEKQVISLLRLIYVSRSISRDLISKILYLLSTHKKLRPSIVNILFSILRHHSTPEDQVPSKIAPVVLHKVYGTTSYASFNIKSSSASIPVGVTKRILDVLMGLTRNSSVVEEMVKPSELEGNEKDTPISLLFSFLSDPYFAGGNRMLEMIMKLLHLCMGHIVVLPKAYKEQAQHLKEQIATLKASLAPSKSETESAEQKKDEKKEDEEKKLKQLEEDLAKIEENQLKITSQLSAIMNEKSVGQLVKALVRPDCPELGVRCAVSIMTNMCTLTPSIRGIILKELSEIARSEAHSVVKTLNASSRKSEKSSVALASTKKSLQELKFCRILRTYTAVLKSSSGKKEATADEETGAEKPIAPVNMHLLREHSLDFVWEALDDYLTHIPDDDEQEEEGKVARRPDKKKKKKSTSLYTALLPLVEAFFSFHAGFMEEKEQSSSDLTAEMETTPTSSSPKSKVEIFLEKNRKFLNSLARSNPSLLNTTLSLMMKHPRYVDFDNKRSWFRSKLAEDQRRISYDGSVRINVRREHIFVDSYYQVRQREPEELKEKLSIRFQGEEGVDAGGLTREWFSVLSKEMLNPNYALFIQCADKTTYQPNPSSHINNEHLSYFKFIGRVIAMAIYHEQLLDCYFTRSFYKHMLGLGIKYQDIESIDPDYYKNLKWMLDNDIDNVLDYTFTQEIEEFGERKEVELKPNGKNIPVTNENKHEYVRLVTELKMTTSIKEQLIAFLESFFEIIPKELISVFNEQELELLMSGLPDVDIDDLRNNTEYEGYTENSPVVQWFWRTVEGMNRNEKALLVQFVTGTSKVPLDGFKSLLGMHGIQRFNIHRVHGTDRLPSAHTCFNQLDLPEYESEEVLKERLMTSILEGNVGFGFV